MRLSIFICSLMLLTIKANCQSAPNPADPCLKLDTNKIRQMMQGTWVETGDTNHILTITPDSVEETIIIGSGINKKTNLSYWNYKYTDNIFSSDAVTCYSLVETKEGYTHHQDFAINSIDAHYMLLGASGKKVFKRKN
jgi:hypothetical protein